MMHVSSEVRLHVLHHTWLDAALVAVAEPVHLITIRQQESRRERCNAGSGSKTNGSSCLRKSAYRSLCEMSKKERSLTESGLNSQDIWSNSEVVPQFPKIFVKSLSFRCRTLLQEKLISQLRLLYP